MARLPKRSTFLPFACAALALGAGSAAHGQEAGGFQSPVAEFANVCSQIDDIDAVRAATAEHGWAPIPRDSNDVIAQKLGEWMAGQGQNALLQSDEDIALFRKSFRGRELLLLLMDYHLSAGSFSRWTKCEMYDFGGEALENELYSVLGQQRAREEHEEYLLQTPPTSLVGMSWHEPHALPGATLTNISSVPQEYYGVPFVNYRSTKRYGRSGSANRATPVPPPPINLTRLSSLIDSLGTSRISPPPPQAPVITTVPAVRPAPLPGQTPQPAPQQQDIGEAVSIADLLDGARMCMNVVSPVMEVNTQPLVDDRWSYTQPQQSRNEAGMSFQSVSYFQGDLMLILQDFGRLVQCRITGRIDDLGQLAELRAAMKDSFGAADARGMERLDPWVANIQRHSPQTDFDNIFIAGDYSLEIMTRNLPLPASGTDNTDQIHLVLVSSVPLPPQYHSREAN